MAIRNADKSPALFNKLRLPLYALTAHFALLNFLLASAPVAAQTGAPSRAPVPGCAWEKDSNATVGLAAWVQRCDFGERKINLFFKDNTLVIHYSDGGEPAALIEVFDRRRDETLQAAVKRVFDEQTADKTFVERCVLTPYRETRAPTGVLRFTFEPDATYQKELTAQADPNDIPEPPCGEWGMAPDGIQYFEVQPESKGRKLLFVRVGQDEPLFDENTLQILDEQPLQSHDKSSARQRGASKKSK